MFSVIIPTMQRASELYPLVDMLVAHPLVGEILIINNVTNPLEWDSPKVRVLQQTQNIYVNPAWNLGAHEARFDCLAIANDDILFDPRFLDEAHRLLRYPWVGIVAPEAGDREGKRIGVECPWGLVTYPDPPFGTLMCLRRKSYFSIPDDFKIWGGDDWLFWMQKGVNLCLRGMPLHTAMGQTSGLKEFSAVHEQEWGVWQRTWADRGAHRWWHYVRKGYRWFAFQRDRVAKYVADIRQRGV